MMFFMNLFLQRQKRMLFKRSIVYEMQFQMRDGPACLCFSLFSKRCIGTIVNRLLFVKL